MLQFYKPNRNNTGVAITFRASDQTPHLYVNYVKQATWDAETCRGTFSSSLNIEGKTINVKLTQSEMGELLRGIENKMPIEMKHFPKSGGVVYINFTPKFNEETKALMAFGLSVITQDKNAESQNVANKFFAPFTLGEARALKEYIIHSLHKSFSINTVVKKQSQTSSQPSQSKEVKSSQSQKPKDDFSDFEESQSTKEPQQEELSSQKKTNDMKDEETTSSEEINW